MTHRSSAGERGFKLYLPSAQAASTVLPLVVMLHGCTQSPDDFAIGTGMNTLAEERGFAVAYPAQAAEANRSLCWNWFERPHQARERGEPALIAGIVAQVAGIATIDRGRVFVGGLSAGGAMAAILGETYPDVFAGVGVHSGLATGLAHDLPSALAAMRDTSPRSGTRHPLPSAPIRLIVVHGSADRTVAPAHAACLVDRALAGRPLCRTVHAATGSARLCRRTVFSDVAGRAVIEQLMVDGLGHGWSGGSPAGSHTCPDGPSASRAMIDFFLG